MRKYDFNPIEEIQKILDGASLSDLKEVLSAPEKLTIGQKAHLATALEKIGETLINKAKEEALERTRAEVSFRDYGVMFSHWPAREITRVNAEEVRKRYPPEKEEHDKLYMKTAASETVAVMIEEPPSAPVDEEEIA